MARPYWTGRIQVSLVSFGVQLYVATESKNQISFHQISRSTGERIRHQKVLQSAVDSGEETAGAAVGKAEIVKGYEYRKGEYVLIEPSEVENLKMPSKHTIDVTQFVTMEELRPEFIEKPYFVAPENDSHAEAFAVIRKALKESGKPRDDKEQLLARVWREVLGVPDVECDELFAYYGGDSLQMIQVRLLAQERGLFIDPALRHHSATVRSLASQAIWMNEKPTYRRDM